MMYGWYGGGMWGWVMMIVMMLLFWGGIAALVVLVVRGTRGSSGGYDSGSRHEDPEHILAQRFARGEIDETEYRARRDALRHRP
jgi:putative membrane protein